MKSEKTEKPVSNRETETINPLIIILLIWVIFLLNGAFSVPLMPPDEPKYASSAEYMLQTGDFITPYFNCQPRFDKPPVIYWLIAASYKIFGISDWAARIPSMLAALGAMFIIFRFAERLYDRKTATMSVVVFASLLHVWVMGRAVAPEFVLVFFELLALYFLFFGLEKERNKFIYAGYLSLALAFLTKGPVGVITPGSIIFLYFLYKKGFVYTAKKLFNPLGLLIFISVGLPWYIVMARIHGQQYINEFFLYHNIYRFTGQAAQHPFSIYYYVPVLIGSLYLWLPFLPHVWEKIKESVKNRDQGLFLIFWFVFVLLFFTISANKLHNYMLISSPPLAILFGASLTGLQSIKPLTKKCLFVIIAIEVLALIALPFFISNIYPSIFMAGFLVILISILIAMKMTSPEKTYHLILVKGLALLMLVNFYIAAYESSIRPADAFVVIESTFENEPIYFYRDTREDLVFYAHRCIPLLRNKAELDEVVKQGNDFILYIREKHISHIEGLQKGVIVPFESIKGEREKSYLVEIEKSY
jgi:4-amino-4-deoxy-L-arabinose transferase-like glycosyltransferase